MHIDYPARIRETPAELARIEEGLRGTAACDRVRMLRLLKSGACTHRTELATLLGYSTRQLGRWWKAYEDGGIEALAEPKPVGGSRERVTDEAWEALRDTLHRGEFTTLADVQRYLRDEHGIVYDSRQGVLDLLRRHDVRLSRTSRADIRI